MVFPFDVEENGKLCIWGKMGSFVTENNPDLERPTTFIRHSYPLHSQSLGEGYLCIHGDIQLLNRVLIKSPEKGKKVIIMFFSQHC